MLFFGNILPYKGLEYAVLALIYIKKVFTEIILVISGNAGNEEYLKKIQVLIEENGLSDNIL